MVDKLRKRLGTHLSAEETQAFWAAAFKINSEVLNIAKRLSSACRTGMLTNNPPTGFDALPSHFPEICRTFSPILFSYQFGTTKPDPKLYTAVSAKLETAPNHILLIDDSAPNVIEARNQGWKAIHYLSPSQLSQDLAAI
jgi:HAD superfamily hydrolase (TIGR01509 family)